VRTAVLLSVQVTYDYMKLQGSFSSLTIENIYNIKLLIVLLYSTLGFSANDNSFTFLYFANPSRATKANKYLILKHLKLDIMVGMNLLTNTKG